MQIAAFLSDLKSLSICSHKAAIALVKPDMGTATDERNALSSQRETSGKPSSAETPLDPDLQRANELVSLHYEVKVKYLETGPDPELIQAAKDVDQVLSALNR
ncbi:uncharacterized protein Z518_01400 [Rhinocladiella mackenziei CBS 650.93]|uniref:Uncharacterized protein n=1 Tax=Rhinocladiella mackenziei CBS 650.93 TaxID=1442369 RepID=A0A0D2HHZ2_9EURO|nr:uncharacterized protein Z518_01400 [Rhinocladiella mackenziei CBS 650.93]KIX10318.1 hypothetical protein Z518_01400 [Rhinocladiella mackenziei CBS 650.93]